VTKKVAALGSRAGARRFAVLATITIIVGTSARSEVALVAILPT
jgi:hypothetical protein